MENYFQILNEINVNDKTEEKNGLTYLSWAYAWGEVKKIHPDANFKVYERENGCIYWTDGKTCWVKTGVTINGIEHIEYLPVMDFRNKSIPVEAITSTDVNKAIQRSLTKAVARHGLGLYIYAGEDLPESEKEEKSEKFKKELFALAKKDLDKQEQLKEILISKYKGKKSNELTELECKNILKEFIYTTKPEEVNIEDGVSFKGSK